MPREEETVRAEAELGSTCTRHVGGTGWRRDVGVEGMREEVEVDEVRKGWVGGPSID